jgi:hypothetical protein
MASPEPSPGFLLACLGVLQRLPGCALVICSGDAVEEDGDLAAYVAVLAPGAGYYMATPDGLQIIEPPRARTTSAGFGSFAANVDAACGRVLLEVGGWSDADAGG